MTFQVPIYCEPTTINPSEMVVTKQLNAIVWGPHIVGAMSTEIPTDYLQLVVPPNPQLFGGEENWVKSDSIWLVVFLEHAWIISTFSWECHHLN